jgi:glutathione synthase
MTMDTDKIIKKKADTIDSLKVLCYMDERMHNLYDDSSSYFLNHMQKDPSLDLTISFVPNPSLAEDKDVIFTRFEIPIKYDFLTELSKYDDGSKIFINSPESKMKYWTKDYMELFLDEDFFPPTWVSQNPEDLAKASKDYQDRMIVKPLDLNGGKGIEDIYPQKFSEEELVNYFNRFTDFGKKKVILQSFIHGVEKLGDKRVNVIFYEPCSAFLRYPAKGSYLCNISAGGRAAGAQINDRDLEIVKGLEPFFKDNGITWAGIDMIGPYLSEINVSSPGGLYEGDVLNNNTKGLDHLMSSIKKEYYNK